MTAGRRLAQRSFETVWVGLERAAGGLRAAPGASRRLPRPILDIKPHLEDSSAWNSLCVDVLTEDTADVRFERAALR